jgi:hypothetical protein
MGTGRRHDPLHLSANNSRGRYQQHLFAAVRQPGIGWPAEARGETRRDTAGAGPELVIGTSG